MLTRPAELVYSINVAYHMCAALAQSVERRLGKAEVGGSIPLGSSKMFENKDFSRNYSSKVFIFILLSEPVILFYLLSVLR